MLHQIGRHLVRHGDLLDGIEELPLPAAGLDYIYSDPPWGEGNLRYWQTMNKKMTGIEPHAVCLETFITRFFDLIRQSSHQQTLVFIEYGLRWVDLIRQQAARIGLQVLAVSQPKYGAGLPLALFTMAYRNLDVPATYIEEVSATTGFTTLKTAVAPFNPLTGQTILDPCCGLGYSARLACLYGMTFYGNELNSKRLEKTIGILKAGERAGEKA